MKKIAVFGGAFNPPTLAHKRIIEILSKKFDSVLVVPSYYHPIKGEIGNFKFRVELVESLISKDKKGVVVSQIEKDMHSEGKQVGFTLDLMKSVAERHKESRLVLVLGDDHRDLDQFDDEHVNEMKEMLIEFEFVSGVDDIRSTYIRNAIKNRECIKHLTTSDVARKVIESGIYDE